MNKRISIEMFITPPLLDEVSKPATHRAKINNKPSYNKFGGRWAMVAKGG